MQYQSQRKVGDARAAAWICRGCIGGDYLRKVVGLGMREKEKTSTIFDEFGNDKDAAIRFGGPRETEVEDDVRVSRLPIKCIVIH